MFHFHVSSLTRTDDSPAHHVRALPFPLQLSFIEKCFAAAFLCVAVGLPCILCSVKSSPEVWDEPAK